MRALLCCVLLLAGVAGAAGKTAKAEKAEKTEKAEKKEAAAEPAKKDEAKPASEPAAASVSRAGGAWSVNTGTTVGEGETVIHGQLGWPGLSGTLLHGVSDSMDLGARFGFNYGSTVGVSVVPGFLLQGVLRVNLLNADTIDFGLEVAPGLSLAFNGGWVVFGVAVPVSGVLGFHVAENFAVHAVLELPFSFNFTPVFAFGLPILFGGGIEYQLLENLALTATFRLGPGIIASGFGSGAFFSFNALAGAAYKF